MYILMIPDATCIHDHKFPDMNSPAYMARWNDDALMLGQRHRRWDNIKTASFQRAVLLGEDTREMTTKY